MASAEEVVRLLTSIDASLKALLARAPKPPAELADDSDLDSQYGDPIVKAADPRDWKGPSMRDRRFSECPPAYLDMVASRLDYFAQQAEAESKLTSSGKPVAPYNRRDAARARGWAKRLRGGWKTGDSGFEAQNSPGEPQQAGFPSDAPAQDGNLLTDDEIAF